MGVRIHCLDGGFINLGLLLGGAGLWWGQVNAATRELMDKRARARIAGVSVMIVIACMIAGIFLLKEKEPPDTATLFSEFVMPLPGEVHILSAYHQPTREWRVVFHLEGPAEGIKAIVTHEDLEYLPPGSPQLRSFQETTLRRFVRPGMANPETIQPADVYESRKHDSGVRTYLLWNRQMAQALLLKQRI